MATQKLHFQWDINDFYDCDLVTNEFFDSPGFFITDPTFKSDWKIRIHPAGFKIDFERNGEKITNTTDNLSLILLRLDSGTNFRAKYSISFLNRNGSRIHTESSSEVFETTKSPDSTEEILKDANIVHIKKNAYKFMDDGVLSVLCEIEIYEKSFEKKAALPEKHLQQRGTSWVIRNTSSPIDVYIYQNKETIFYLPCGKSVVRFKGYIKILSGAWKAGFEITDDVYPNIKQVPVTIVRDGKKYTWNITRSPGMHFNESTPQALILSTRCMVESKPFALQIDITPYIRKMQSDYRNMFSQSEGSDVSIVVDGKTLQMHKNVLISRCPVFAAMFTHEWHEKNTQTVTIKEFDYKTILAMMEFIYFGGSDDYFEDDAANPAELLKAAHMYQLDDLKNKCEQRLCRILESDNVFSHLVLAETYDLINLKSEVLAFVSHNREF